MNYDMVKAVLSSAQTPRCNVLIFVSCPEAQNRPAAHTIAVIPISKKISPFG